MKNHGYGTRETGKGGYAVGVDLGGSHMTVGLVHEKDGLVEQRTMKTYFGIPPSRVILGVRDFLHEMYAASGIEAQDVLGLGIGAPGMVNFHTGVIQFAPNLGWRDVQLADGLSREISLPVVIDNDANGAALAEWRFGAGRGTRAMACVTVGTGVGAGIIIDGTVCRGARGYAGEIGHIKTAAGHAAEEPRVCTCGGRGCLEMVAGGKAIAERARKKAPEGSLLLALAGNRRDSITAKTVFEAARQGDMVSREIVAEAALHLGTSLANLVNLLDLEAVVVGGGVSRAGETLLASLRQVIRENVLPVHATLQVRPAELGTEAGVTGAALLVLELRRP